MQHLFTATGLHVKLPDLQMHNNTAFVITCWELAVEAHSMCSYVAAVCLTRLTAEAAVNPAQLRGK